ncbi:probable anion transporter 6, chloroplastic isoform X2 [Macadamia integrifolia]|uniref:probable anion transporter 6, chloroplastic isoform X2 n=1 Tax=Macadamia integrifolia TaxID=60698 RepID=UPI001C4F9D5E|nr:probable anion transporter 6, chloroplastic isoform X2 [Macadamia integrifolia]
MANFSLRTENYWFTLPHHTKFQSPIFNTCLKLPQPHLLPSKRGFKFTASCSIKEKRDVADEETERAGVLGGLLPVGESAETVASTGSENQTSSTIGSYGAEGFYWRWPPWKDLPQRYKLIGTTSLAFVICNMDKVNLSVAIIPMSHQFGWNSSMAGLVQSSFFWGYALSQLPGGWFAKIFGGRQVLEFGVFSWSLATMLVPSVAGFMPGLVLSRILVGIGEGVSPSAATDLIARSIPLEERSRAVAFVFGGLSVGSVLGLLLAPPLIQNFGWESVFYIFGILGLLWCLGFQFVKEGQSSFTGRNISRNFMSAASFPSNWGTKPWSASLKELSVSLKDVPWKEFFQSRAVWAMIYVHFCGSWGHYTCLSWLPTYFSEELDLNLTEAAGVAVLPPLASILVSGIAAQFADNLIASGVETTMVRKICQTIAFLSPAFCMTLSSLNLGLPPWEIVALLTGGLALSSFALSGLYCTHQDISPEYSSVLLGITNTVGAVPGIVGVVLTGYLLDSTHSWSAKPFVPC